MDRLARNLDDLTRIVLGLTSKGVLVEFVKEHVTFMGEDSAMSQLLLSVMGAFAERSLIRERQRKELLWRRKQECTRGANRLLALKELLNCARGFKPEKRRRHWPESLASAGRRCVNTVGFINAFDQTLDCLELPLIIRIH